MVKLIIAMVVSFLIILKFPKTFLRGGRLGATIFEGFIFIIAFFIGLNNSDLFIIISAVSAIIFAIIFTLMGLKQGDSIAKAIAIGIGQSIVSLFGGAVIVLTLGSRQSSQNQPQQQSKPVDPIKNADLERADYVARDNGYADANAWAQNNGYTDASSAYDDRFFDGKL